MTQSEIEKVINNYKKQIKEDEATINRLEGKLESLLKDLKEKYQLNSVETAKKELSKLDKEADVLEKEIQEALQVLQKDYPIT